MNSKQINIYLEEDMPFGDITTNAIFGTVQKKVVSEFIAKENLVVSGFETLHWIMKKKFKRLQLKILTPDGSFVKKGKVMGILIGPVKDVLMVERLCLNLLQRLSGIATLTSRYTRLAKPYGVTILDTRKTTPGLRQEEKKAVRDGGGTNHRCSLSDQYLIKDNHIDAVGSVKKAIQKVEAHRKQSKRKRKIEVEVRTFSEFQEALAMKPEIILLDNQKGLQIKKMVAWRNQNLKKKQFTQLEISGGMNLKNLNKYLTLGVERISVGALTHSAPAADISLQIKG